MTLAVDMEKTADTIASRAAGFDRLRADLCRLDISDETLQTIVEDALEALGVNHGVDDILFDTVADDFRLRLYAMLCVPQPYAPMTMPEQVLERPRLSALERMRMAFRRLAS